MATFNISEDFRNEVSSNILDEIDDLAINTYFENIYYFESKFVDSFRIVEAEKSKYLEITWPIFDEIVKKANKNFYIHIFEELCKLRYNAFCQVISTKNSLITFENPFFVQKSLDSESFDVTFLEKMKNTKLESTYF